MSWFTGGEKSAVVNGVLAGALVIGGGLEVAHHVFEETERTNSATYYTDAVETTLVTANRQHNEIDAHIGIGPGYITDTGPISEMQSFPELRIGFDPGWLLHVLRLSGAVGNYPVENLQYFETTEPFADYNALAEHVLGLEVGPDRFENDKTRQERLGSLSTALYVQSEGQAIPAGKTFVVEQGNYYDPFSGVRPLELDCNNELDPSQQGQDTPPVCVLAPKG